MPWGLLIILALYGLGVLFYVWKTYWDSPEYQAAGLAQHAIELLGVDDGRKTTPDDLREAFDAFLEAGRLVPEEEQFAETLERLRNRFDERHIVLDEERVRRAEAVSVLTRRVQEARAPVLVVGARERGWAPDQLIAGPKTAFAWALPGVVLIIACWAYLRVTAWRVRARERDDEVKRVEAEVKKRGRANRPKSRPQN